MNKMKLAVLRRAEEDRGEVIGHHEVSEKVVNGN
jgi:hypothetical protein